MLAKVSTDEQRERMRAEHEESVAYRKARIDALVEAERERVAMVLRGGAEPPQPIPALPAAPAGPLKGKQRRDHRDRISRAKSRQDAVMRDNATAANDEKEAEKLAPGVRRRAVTDAAGNVLRPVQLERDGAIFRRANPVKRLAQEMPEFVTDRHVDAAARFLADCEEVGGGIGLGASDWASKVSGGMPGSGVSDAKQSAILAQCVTRSKLDGALAWMGGSGGIVGAVLVSGLSVPVWAKRAGINRQVAQGMLVAGLDRLADYYLPIAPQTQRIRAAFFASMRDD